MEEFIYSIGTLRNIANSYKHIYQLIEWKKRGVLVGTVKNPYSCVEYKADFDTAMAFVGKKRAEDLGDYDFRKMRDYLNGSKK